MNSRGAFALVFSVALPAMPQAQCLVNELDLTSWSDKQLVVIILGIITAIILLVLASLPVCCGVMKEKNLKPMAVTTGVFGCLCLLMPLLTSFIIASMLIDGACDRCGPSDSACPPEPLQKIVGAMAVATNCDVFADTTEEAFTSPSSITFSFLHLLFVALSIVGMSLSCCICCPCCGPLLAYKNQQGGGAAQETAALVDQPASS